VSAEEDIMSKLPLEGVRILEASDALALPHATHILGDMGAEIILVEHAGRPNMFRFLGPFPDNEPREDSWNRSGSFNQWNRNKLSLTLDLSHPKAKDIFKALVKVSDVVAENFTSRVMKNFGLDYPELKKVKEDLIMLSNTGYGHSGPWRNYVGMAQVVEAATTAHVTGWPDRGPGKAGQSIMDIVCSFNVAAAILTALHYRRRTGKGQWIDHSMLQACVPTLGSALMDAAMNERDQFRMGNRDPYIAPQGCYRCQGEESWVVISVSSDAEWQQLCRVMEQPGLSQDPRFADALSRWKHQDELDPILEKWTSQRDRFALMEILQKAGVPSGAVLSSKDLFLNPHVKAREYFELATHDPDTGVGTRPYAGRPYTFSETPGRIRRATSGFWAAFWAWMLKRSRPLKRNTSLATTPGLS
jgi:benzylsuccinate CoA-transferase BbsF subunit